MSIAATPTNGSVIRDQSGRRLKSIKLAVTGLTAGANNSVPHALKDHLGNGAVPSKVEVQAAGPLPPFVYQAADGTHVFLTAQSAGDTACTLLLQYGD